MRRTVFLSGAMTSGLITLSWARHGLNTPTSHGWVISRFERHEQREWKDSKSGNHSSFSIVVYVLPWMNSDVLRFNSEVFVAHSNFCWHFILCTRRRLSLPQRQKKMKRESSPRWNFGALWRFELRPSVRISSTMSTIRTPWMAMSSTIWPSSLSTPSVSRTSLGDLRWSCLFFVALLIPITLT